MPPNTRRMTRIAFIAKGAHEYSRRLARGVCKYASPEKGFITRDFLIESGAMELPAAIQAWAPHAVVSFVAAEDFAILAPLEDRGLPLVSVARATPKPGRAVVLGDAEEVYDSVYEHFEPLGLKSVWHFSLGEADTFHSSQQRYRKYAEEHGLPWLTYCAPDPENYEAISQMQEADPEFEDWLLNLPKPVGIFSQQSYAGQYLCRACEFLRLKVPTEVAIIGTDGFDIATASNPSVTSVRVPAEGVGFKAAEIVVSMLDGAAAPREIVRVGGVRLVVRRSTQSRQLSGCDIDAAMEFIDLHACDGVKVNDVVEHTQGVSRVTFHKHFLERTGATPAHTLLDRRLSEARRLLTESEISAGAIAGMCGYQDYIHFYRTFKKAEGLSPSEYRALTS